MGARVGSHFIGLYLKSVVKTTGSGLKPFGFFDITNLVGYILTTCFTKEVRMTKSLFFVITSFLTINAAASEYHSSDTACPISTPVTKTKLKSHSLLTHFYFENNTVIRRIGITAITRGGKDLNNIKFKWIPKEIKWRIASGEFVITANGKEQCFYLGGDAGIPNNVEASEFTLEPTNGVEIKSVAFSEKPSDYLMKTCPSKDLCPQFIEYLTICNTAKKSLACDKLIDVFVKLTPRYDCLRSFDTNPVPAIWLCDEIAGESYGYPQPFEKAVGLVSRLSSKKAKKFFVSEELRSTLDGALAEEYMNLSSKAGKKNK
jgi:hypothetical protein